MNRPLRALGLVALLVAGLSVSAGAGAVGSSGTDTTEPSETTEVSETTEPVESTELVETTEVSETTDVSETSEPVETTEVPETTPSSLPPFEPEPIEWSSLGDGLEEGRLEVPIDYANPEDGTFSLYLVRHLAADPDARDRLTARQPGRARVRRNDPRRVGRVHLQPRPARQLRHRWLGSPRHRRERAVHRLHRQLRRVLRRHRHHPRRRVRAAADHRRCRGLRRPMRGAQ